MWCLLYGGPIRLIMFLAGILVHELVDRQGVKIDTGLAVAGFATALVAAGFLNAYESSGVWKVRSFQPGELVQVWLLFVGFLLVCGNCFGGHRSALARLFEWRPVRWLGNMSYSYYLIHALGIKAVLLVATKLIPHLTLGPIALAALLLVAFAASLIGPIVLFVFIERPLSLSAANRVRAVAPAIAGK